VQASKTTSTRDFHSGSCSTVHNGPCSKKLMMP
jgi:hypothetical protein